MGSDERVGHMAGSAGLSFRDEGSCRGQRSNEGGRWSEEQEHLPTSFWCREGRKVGEKIITAGDVIPWKELEQRGRGGTGAKKRLSIWGFD